MPKNQEQWERHETTTDWNCMKKGTIGTWKAGIKCENDRIEEPAAVILGDVGSVEPDEVDERVAVGGVRGSVVDELDAEWDPREKEEDGEKDGDGVRSLEEPRDDGGTDLLRRRRLGVYETRSSLGRHCVAVRLFLPILLSLLFLWIKFYTVLYFAQGIWWKILSAVP